MQRFLILAAAAVVSLQGLGHAEDETVGEIGQAATVRVERDGSRFEIVVTPPFYAAVSRSVLAWLSGVEAETEMNKPVDLSDYKVRVTMLKEPGKAVAANCSGSFSIKAKPVNLGPNKSWQFQSDAIFMDISAFPTKGNVDLAIFYGPDDNLSTCSSSFRGKLMMDTAGCALTSCRNTGSNDDHKGIIGNITDSPATYVGTYHLFFVTLP